MGPLTDTAAADIVKPVARDISRNPLPHVAGLVAAVLVVVLLTVAGTALMGGAGTVFGLFLGMTTVLGLGVVAYALGTTGLADLARSTRQRV